MRLPEFSGNLPHPFKAAAAVLLSGLALGGTVETAAAHADPLPYSEWTVPDNGHYNGVAMVIHGGAWTATGPDQVNNSYMHRMTDTAHQAGLATLSVDYPEGKAAVPVLLKFYAEATRRAHGRPVGVIGSSAGGQLALEVAEIEGSKASFAVTEAAPIDLNTLADPVRQVAAEAFAPGVTDQAQITQDLKDWSPITHTGNLPAHVLLGNAQNDPVVSPNQAEMLNGLPGVKVDILSGPTAAAVSSTPNIINDTTLRPFTHTMVGKAAFDGFIKDEINMLRGVAKQTAQTATLNHSHSKPKHPKHKTSAHHK